MKKKTLTIFAALLLVLSTVLCACGGGTNTGNGDSQENQNQVASKDTVVFGSTLGFEGLDPHSVQQAGTRAILFNVYEGLMKAGIEEYFTPAVAESYNVSEDGKTYTFVIREGLKFHDGSVVTAGDVKYSLERFVALKPESELAVIDTVTVLDDKTVEVVLKSGNTEMLSAFSLAAIIPEAVGDDIASNPVGTGPYCFDSYKEGEYVQLKAFADFRDGEAAVKNAKFMFMEGSTEAYQMLQAGSIDILPYLSADQVATLSADYDVVDGFMTYAFQFFLNSADPNMANAAVRQAINYAIDVDSINQITCNGKGGRIGANLPNTMNGYFSEAAAQTYKFDAEKAKELLDSAGATGMNFNIAVPNVNALYTTTAEITVENLKAVGINATMELMETEKWYDLYVNGLTDEYQAMLLAWDTADFAPGSWLSLYTTDSAKNFMHYSNADFDAAIATAKAAIDVNEKTAAYMQAQQILADDAAAVFLFTPADYVAVSKAFSGYHFYPTTAWDMYTLSGR